MEYDDKPASPDEDYRSSYHDRPAQAASKAYALNVPAKNVSEVRYEKIADFSYDSFHSPKNVEMFYMAASPEYDGSC